MSAIKLKRATTAGTSLPYGEMAIGGNELYFGNSSDLPVKMSKDGHTHSIANISGLQAALNGKLSTTGNAATATKLATPVKINGVNFDGSAAITITAAPTTHSHSTSQITGFDSAVLALSPAGPRTPVAHTLNSHSDVTITSPSSGQVLKFNGSSWVNSTDSNTNNYVSGMTGNGNSTLTLTRNGLSNLTLNLAHSHSWSDVPAVSGISVIGKSTTGAGVVSELGVATLQSMLGLGSLAYSSATIPTNTNQLTNGSGYITSSGSITGNAATATKLASPVNINGVAFDGSASITVAAAPTTHSHPTSQITGFDSAVLALSPAGARTPTTHSHPTSQITGFDSAVLALSPAGARTPTAHEHMSIEVMVGQDAGTSKLSVFQDINGTGYTTKTGLALFRQYGSSQPILEISQPYGSSSSIDFITNEADAFNFNKPVKVDNTNVSLAGHAHEANDITDFTAEVLALSPAGARPPTQHDHQADDIVDFDSRVLSLSPPWKLIRSTQASIPTSLTANNITVVSGNYYNKILAFEVRVATATDSYETHIVFARMGSNTEVTTSATYDRFYSWTAFDGRYLKTHSFKAYCSNATSTTITVGAMKHLVGSFLNNTIEWTTPTITTYIERIWLVN